MTKQSSDESPSIPGTELIRTLVVDDSEAWLRAVERLLQTEPRIKFVGTAREGREALQKIEAKKPHIVLMDLYMPRMNGFEATVIIRERFPDVRVLMMSIVDGSAIRAACTACGAHGFVAKHNAGAALLPTIFRIAGD